MNLPSPSELFVIIILALIVFGPKRLPEIGRQVGRALAEVRRISREFEREVRDATEPLAKEVREAESEARKQFEIDDDFSTFKTTPKQDPEENPGPSLEKP